jgi:hypothetical protein
MKRTPPIHRPLPNEGQVARRRRTLIGVVLLITAIVGCGYVAVGPVVFLFSVTLVGGFGVWLLTTYRADVDPDKFLAPYLLTVILFIGHVYEEYAFHIELPLGRIMHITLTQDQFLTVAAFAGPIIWLAGAALVLVGLGIGYFLVSTFLFGMMFGELSHFAFPFMQDGSFHYVAGMYTCLLPIVGAWYTFVIIWREVQRERTGANQALAPELGG